MEYNIGKHNTLVSVKLNDKETAVIPDGVENIDSKAFIMYRETLKTVYFPPSVKRISGYAFHRCTKLENVYFSEGLESIGEDAFSHCTGLKNVTLPKSLKYIEEDAFYETPFYDDLGGEFAVCGDGILMKYNGSGGDVVIPDEVKTIYEGCFYLYFNITSITLPSGIKQIGTNLFDRCLKLERITLPEGLLKIKSKAFINCASLKEITLPASLEDIYSDAFFSCSSLERITVREGCKRYKDIGGVLFDKARNTLVNVPILYGQTHYTIPECVRTIDENAFQNNEKIKHIVIPETVKKINTDSFFMCSSLESVTILSKDVIFGYCPFISCERLTEVYMPNGCDDLDEDVFDECNNIRLLSYKGYEFRADRLDMKYYTAENLDELIIDKNYDTGADTDIVMIHTVAAADCVVHHLKAAEEHVRVHAVGILHTLIDGEAAMLFKGILSLENILTREQAEIVAKYAIEHTQKNGNSEFQVMTAKYISDNFGSMDFLDSLKL